MPGLGGKVLGKLGASVQNIPGGELYQALSSGALDGLEWVGPFADERAGFQEVAKSTIQRVCTSRVRLWQDP